MQQVIAHELAWLSTDEEALDKFLKTDTGRRLLQKLGELAPQLLAKGDTNEILIRSGEARAFQLMLSRILELSHHNPDEQPTKPAADYIPLTDDNQWQDGKVLDPSLPMP